MKAVAVTVGRITMTRAVDRVEEIQSLQFVSVKDTGLRKLGHHKKGWSLDKCKFTRTAVSLFSFFPPEGKKPLRSQ